MSNIIYLRNEMLNRLIIKVYYYTEGRNITVDDIKSKKTFFELGFTPLSLIHLINEVERVFSKNISCFMLRRLKKIPSLYKFVRN